MTQEQIDASLEDMEADSLAIIAAWQQADRETKDIALGILRGDIDPGIVRGEIDIATNVRVLR